MENLKEKLDLIIEEFCKENGYVCEFDDNNEIMIDMCYQQIVIKRIIKKKLLDNLFILY